MKWLNPTQELGTLVARQSHRIEFNYSGDIEVTNIIPTCQCSNAQWDKEQKRIIVNYHPGSVPFHLENQGFYLSTKKIIVEYKDNQSVILTFTSKIVNSVASELP